MFMWTDRVFIMMLLAYVVVEFIFHEKLNLLKRTLLFMGLFFLQFVWIVLGVQSHPFEQILIVPIAGFAYWAISSLLHKFRIEDEGRQFWNFLLCHGVHLVAIFMIALPFKEIILPAGFAHHSVYLIKNWEMILVVMIANIWVAPQFIRTILGDLAYRTTYVKVKEGCSFEKRIQDEGAYHAGTLIGILERLLIISVVLLSDTYGINYSFIGFILGTKSLARFKRFENQEFVEYFIVGTLTSILFALVSIWPLKFM